MPAPTVQATSLSTSLIPVLTVKDFEQAGYSTRPQDRAVILHITNPRVQHKTLLLRGKPGVGKTEFAKALARAISNVAGSCAYLEYLTHSWTSNEHLFVGPNVMNIAVGVTQREDAIIKGVLWRAAEHSHTEPTVVLLDEFEKCQQRSEALVLGFLQDGRVQDSDPQDSGQEVYANLNNLIVVLTSNEARDLYEATLRRCFRYRMPYLEPKVEIALLRKLTGAPVSAITDVVSMAGNIRNRASSVSLQEMRYLLEDARMADGADVISTLIEGTLTKSEGDMTPKEIADLSVSLFNAFAVPQSAVK